MIGSSPSGKKIVLMANDGIDDAICVVQPTLAPNQFIAHASAFNVTEAAREVIRTCVLRRRLGGVATTIGTLSLCP